MARTFIRQDTQIRNSDIYDDTLTMSDAESSATHIEDDLNYMRTQLKVLGGQTNWFDALSDDFNLTEIHDKRFLYWIQKTDDVAIPAAQNYVLLAGATKPTDNIAYGSDSLGAVTSQLAGAIGSNDLTTAANNGNLLQIRDADTNDVMYTSNGHMIYGLLQVGSAATDGNAFGDTGNDQGQISFVYINPSTEVITAVPVADIENKTIEYGYKKRVDFYNLPEGAFDPSVTFVESVSSTTIDLQDVYDNDANGQFDLTSGKDWTANLSGNADAKIVNGATSFWSTDYANTLLRIGVNNIIDDGLELRFGDVGNSNYVGFKAPALTADQIWTLPDADGDAGQVIFTDGSGVLGFKDNNESKKAWYLLVGDIAANTAINISSFTNPDGMDFGSSASDWEKGYDVFVNGVLQLNGQSASADNDVYWLSSATLAFEYDLKINDIVQIIERG
jgi:hypothetical protein